MNLKQSPYAAGITELLYMLESTHLRQLAKTATNQHIMAGSDKEAVELILRYSENLERFFSYRRITCQLLFDYLHKKKVSFRTGESKQEMIVRVKEHWEKKQKTKAMSLPKKDKTDKTVRKYTATPPERDRGTTNVNINYSAAATPTASTSFNLNVNSENIEVTLKMKQGGGEMVKSDVFVKEFCTWFYIMLNRLQPQGAMQPGDNFSPNVFMANCNVDIYLCGPVTTEKHATEQNSAYELLRSICTDFRLMFVPQLDTGVRAEMSQHGLVKLYCLGTLHQGNAFAGVFEQEFGLVKGPQNRWKIMMSKINLKQAQQNSVCLPALPQGPVFEIPR